MAKYIVKKGDNLSTIAKNNGVKLKDILSINKIDNPDYIQVGQKINLPDNKSNSKGTNYTQFSDDYDATPKWNKITPNAGNSKTIKSTLSKQVLKTKPASVKQKDEPSFLDSMKNKIYETYQDVTTAIDQQTSKKVVAKPKVKIDDSFINYGYKELGTYKDESFKAGKKDSLLSAMNVFDNDKGFDYIVSPKVKEGKKTFNNVKGVAHFLMDTDITPNQKYTTPYIEKGNNSVKSAQPGKFTPYLGTNPDDYVMYYKNIGNDKMNVKYGQLKDKDKYKGYEQIKVRSIPFGDLDFNNKRSAGFAKKASYIGTLDGKQTSIITDPESNDVYGRFSGGSGIFYFKEPKTGKTISVDVSGSVNTIKKVGEELSKKYNVDPKQLQFLYHDMGSYSAKPKSHNGVLSNEQWQNYNVNNKGYSGAALMYPMEFGGMAASDNVDMGYYTNPVKYFAAKGANIPTSWDNYRTKLNSKEESKFLKWRSTLPENLQNENDYDLRGYYKEYGNKPIPKGIEPHLTDEFKLPNHPTFSENSRYYNDETNYLGGKWDNGLYQWKYTPNSEFKNEVIEQKGFDELRNDFILNNHNILSRNPNIFKKYGGYAEMGFDTNDYYSAIANERPRDSATSYQQDVKGKFNWLNTLAKTPIEQIQKDIDSTPLTKNYMLNKTPKGYFNVYDRNNKPVGYSIDGKTLVPQEPNFEDGGLVRAWIQKFMKGGYIAEGGYPNAQELTQPTTNYYNWGNYNQDSFVNPIPLNQNPFQQVPMAQSNMPQNIGTNYKMNFNASNDEVNKGNSMADSMIGGKKGLGISDPMSMGMDIAGKSMDATASLMSSFGKDDSKTRAFGQGASNAMKVAETATAPFKNIPVAGKAIDKIGKTLGFIIGGALEARRQGIKNEETAKNDLNLEYKKRNLVNVNQPSYYGQYMAKYGANPKMMEQRVMDDIYSDFDKYMKLI